MLSPNSVGLPAASPSSASEITEAIRELLCQKCGRDYPVWFTDNRLWNQVAADDFHFLCMDCFAVIAEQKGVVPTAWYVTEERLSRNELLAENLRLTRQLASLKEEQLTAEEAAHLCSMSEYVMDNKIPMEKALREKLHRISSSGTSPKSDTK